VSTVQFEAGAGVVIELPNLPVPAIVAVFALAAKCATMNIVALMTSIAVDGGFVLIESAFVATVALRYTMLAQQRVRGVAIVLKEQGFPVAFDMTALAGLTKQAFMRVVLLMAGVAVGWGFVLVEYARVARVTFGLSVIAVQRVGGITIVLKEQGFPTPLGVTAFAGFAEPAFMRVVFLMAPIAVSWRLVLVEMPLMAGCAFRCDMVPS